MFYECGIGNGGISFGVRNANDHDVGCGFQFPARAFIKSLASGVQPLIVLKVNEKLGFAEMT